MPTPMSFWRSWIILWALMPVFSAFFAMANHRVWNDMVPVQPLHAWAIGITFFGSAILFFLAPFAVLKWHIKGYGAGAHLLASLGALAGWAAFFLAAAGFPWGEGPLGLERGFARAVMSARQDAPVWPGDVFALPWGGFLAARLVQAAAVFAGPVLVLCVVARRPGRFGWVMIFVLLGAGAVAVSDALFELGRPGAAGLGALNDHDWSARLGIIASWSASSMIGASISALGIGGLVDADEKGRAALTVAPGLRLAVLTAATLWSLGFGAQYIARPAGLASDLAALKKSFTAPPRNDVSVGERVIASSHVLDVETYTFRNSDYVEFDLSPDGRSAVVVEAFGKNGSRLVALDVATGERRADLTPPMSKYERASYLWTKDGRHLVVRHRGASLQAGGYERFETVVALFALPGFEQIAEWQSTAPGCWHSDVGPTNLAEAAGGTLVVQCFGSFAPAHAEPLAAMISLPSLEDVGIRNRAVYEAPGSAGGLVALGGAVYTPLREQGDDPGVVLANIVHPERSVALEAPFSEERGGGLTFQGFVTDAAAGDVIGMRFCGATNSVANPPPNATEAPWGPSFCRTVRYSTVDGAYIGHIDDAETRLPRPSRGPRDFSVETGRWDIVGTIDPASLTGELRVRDAGSGEIVQTVESSAQRPLVATEAADLLFTHRVDARTIAVYEILE